MAYRQQPAQDELEMETMAKTELSRLKRQYRIMENDRAACAEDARLQLRNQRNMIDRLEDEKADLVLAIRTAKSKAFARKDQEMDERLRCLLAKRAKYIDMIENEKRQIAELDTLIGKVAGIANVEPISIPRLLREWLVETKKKKGKRIQRCSS